MATWVVRLWRVPLFALCPMLSARRLAESDVCVQRIFDPLAFNMHAQQAAREEKECDADLFKIGGAPRT